DITGRPAPRYAAIGAVLVSARRMRAYEAGTAYTPGRQFTICSVNCLSAVYDVAASYARIRLALTNTAPMAAYRGAGRPVMSYALERLVEHAARELGMDPAEFRRRNFIRSFPYK